MVLPPDRPVTVDGHDSLTMICHSHLLGVVLLPPLPKKKLGRETLSPALFYVLRCQQSEGIELTSYLSANLGMSNSAGRPARKAGY
jgi:hypothetical protein